MATFSSITRQHILRAIAECDERGAENFLSVYGLTAFPRETFTYEGTTYDSRAIIGVAHRFATGHIATAEEFKDTSTAAHFLKKAGFAPTAPGGRIAAPRHSNDSRPAKPARSLGSGERTRTVRARGATERPAAVCPSCFTQLPATGACDDCD
ncbi:MAG: hypothetical protein FWG11_06500 [Promicromonosporaceae bacterium]|nr:hypothetical protein [Promicromonosporaceae bacterium]